MRLEMKRQDPNPLDGVEVIVDRVVPRDRSRTWRAAWLGVVGHMLAFGSCGEETSGRLADGPSDATSEEGANHDVIAAEADASSTDEATFDEATSDAPEATAEVEEDVPPEIVLPPDEDGDGIADDADACPAGVSGWQSDPASDHDGDGCRDADEDDDDDNDGRSDPDDACPVGTSSGDDYDDDGCHDPEEEDDDGDGVPDDQDECGKGVMGWSSTIENDKDQDGCRDEDEDEDDDGDRILDTVDPCPDLNSAVFPSICISECTSIDFMPLHFVDVDLYVPHGSRLTTVVEELGSHLRADRESYPQIGLTYVSMIGPTGVRERVGSPSVTEHARVPFVPYWVGRQRLAVLHNKGGSCTLGEIEVNQTTSTLLHVQYVGRTVPAGGVGPYYQSGASVSWLGSLEFALRGHVAPSVDLGIDFDRDGTPDPWADPSLDFVPVLFLVPDWVDTLGIAALGGSTFTIDVSPAFDLRIGAHLPPDRFDGSVLGFTLQVFSRGALVQESLGSINNTQFFDGGTIKGGTGEFVPRRRCNPIAQGTCESDSECGLGLTCSTTHIFTIREEHRDEFQ